MTIASFKRILSNSIDSPVVGGQIENVKVDGLELSVNTHPCLNWPNLFPNCTLTQNATSPQLHWPSTFIPKSRQVLIQ